MKSFVTHYLDDLGNLLKQLDSAAIAQAIEWLRETRDRDGTVYICGNGGSASIASQMVVDIVKGGSFGKKKRIKMIGLTDSIATITAYGNDVSYDSVFVEPLKNFARAGDLLIAISGSGNSPNVLRAVEYANSVGCRTIGLTTGEGGMLVTSRDDIFARVLRLRDHGREPGDRLFINHEVAFKYKMSALQAAFGLAQLERIDELVARKRELFAWYAQHFAGMNGITLNREAATTKNTYWMVTALFSPQLGLQKEDMISQLRQRNIDSRPFFHPLSSLPAYREFGGPQRWQPRDPASYDIGARGVNLPSGFNMTEALVERVVGAVKEIACTGGSTIAR